MSKQEWITENIKVGEQYAGLMLGKNGALDYHLVLLPGLDDKAMTWQQAMAAAKKAGGELPTRSEQALLFANLKDQFQPTWYWSGEQHATLSDSAWYQLFYYGTQNGYYKSGSCRARAVRRLIIQ